MLAAVGGAHRVERAGLIQARKKFIRQRGHELVGIFRNAVPKVYTRTNKSVAIPTGIAFRYESTASCGPCDVVLSRRDEDRDHEGDRDEE